MVVILSSSKFVQSSGNNFSFWSIRKILYSRLFLLSEDHQFWVNLWNFERWRHSPYTSEQALIIRLYIRQELSIISILFFIHSLQDDLPQVFIEHIGFTVESISKDITLRHSCGLVFCVKCLAKWAAKESKFLLITTFCATSWKCCSIIFSECSGYFQRKSHSSIYTLPCKWHNIHFIHLCMHT